MAVLGKFFVCAMGDDEEPSKKRWWEESWEDYDWDWNGNGWRSSSSWWEEPWTTRYGGSASSTNPPPPEEDDMEIEPWSVGHAVPSLVCIAEGSDEEGILEDPAEPDEEGIFEEHWELDDDPVDDAPVPMDVDSPKAVAVNFLYFLNVVFFVTSLCTYHFLEEIQVCFKSLVVRSLELIMD